MMPIAIAIIVRAACGPREESDASDVNTPVSAVNPRDPGTINQKAGVKSTKAVGPVLPRPSSMKAPSSVRAAARPPASVGSTHMESAC